jgi:hypothetical protein
MASPIQEIRDASLVAELPASTPPIVHKGQYRLPPGLRFNLPLYYFAKFFDRTNPILLFEYLQRFGRAAHYRMLAKPYHPAQRPKRHPRSPHR